MAAATAIPLSNNDLQILNTVFDPESSSDTPTIRIDACLPPDPHIFDPAILTNLRNRELSAIRLIESYATQTQDQPNNSNADVSSTRRETYLQAHAILTSIITEHPDYASAYNNRAQLHRWRFGSDSLPFVPSAPTIVLSGDAQTSTPNNSPWHQQQQQQVASIAQTLADLATAIKLASPRSQAAAVSPQQARILANAWTQRGAVYLSVARGLKGAGLDRLPDVVLASSASGTATSAASASASAAAAGDASAEAEAWEGEGEMEYGFAREDGAEEWKGWDRVRFEEEGSRCFYVAGLYGSEVGRAMAVMANPYARLCGAIVKEAIRGESGKG